MTADIVFPMQLEEIHKQLKNVDIMANLITD